MRYLSFSKRLELLKLYLIQRRRRRCSTIYEWKIVEWLVTNPSDPITCSFPDRRGTTCVVYHAVAGRLSTLKYNNFRWRSIRMFNGLPKAIRILSSCCVLNSGHNLTLYKEQCGLDSIIVWMVGLITWWLLRGCSKKMQK